MKDGRPASVTSLENEGFELKAAKSAMNKRRGMAKLLGETFSDEKNGR